MSTLNRRQFIKNSTSAVISGLAFPTIIPASSLGRDNNTAPSNKINLALIGTGWGLHTAGKFLQFKDTNLSAICDADTNRAKNAANAIRRFRPNSSTKIFPNFQEIFSQKNCDAIIVATPNHWHEAISVAAMHNGLDVYLEAPLAHTIEESRNITNTAHLHGRILQCALFRRSSPIWNHAISLVKNGTLGNLTHIEIGSPPTPAYATKKPSPQALQIPKNLDYEMWLGPALHHNYDPRFIHYYWRWISSFGGGELAETSFHYADAALRAANMEFSGPELIYGNGNFSTMKPYDVELDYHCNFIFQNGVQIQLSTKFPRGVKFIGDRAWLHISDSGLKSSQNITPKIHQNFTQSLDPESAHCRNFLDCVKTRQNPCAPAEPAHRAVSLTRLAHIAILTTRPIHWNPNTETITNDAAATAFLHPIRRAGFAF